ncbi:MFS transporter [Halococcus hamelinensis]|uniref:Major facilitator superfamily transporter n=2 Tax=Halococcus hamelinensis TaxID=332168 RepID=M0M579_9EURY|nr:MFS transporter [Halococcus hamelinensis]EMA39794.1 major facilitator superfamily transporter [Halococcus hamelinensis 100A6]
MSRETEGSWSSVATVAGWQVAASLCYYSIFAATGVVRDAFSLSATEVGLFTTAALLGYTVALVPSGAAVDGYGEKRVMVFGLVGLAVATVGVSLAPSYGLLLVAGAVLGGAYSSAMPASNRGILASAPAGRGNFAMGLKQVGVTAGSAIASLVITGLAAVVAWQAGFWVIAALAGGYVVGFVALYDGTRGEGTLSVPDFSVLRSNRAYLVLVGVGFFMGASIFAMLGYIVLYVVDDLGHTTLVGGVVLALTQIMGSAARIGAGGVADRLGGARGAATVALVQMAVAVVLFAVLATGLPSFPVALVVFAGLGLTVYGSTGVFYSCLGTIVDDDDIGAATAGGQTAINVGGLVAPPTFGLLVEHSGYSVSWAFLGALTVAGTVLLVVVRRRLGSSAG